MAKLPQKAWAALWVARGGDPSRADLASAVVMAESGGDTTIYNGICCYGGYQFNVNTESKQCATNPVCATDKAIKHSNNGRDWGIWEGYTNGSYRAYLGKSGHAPRNKREAGNMLVDFKLPIGPDIPFPGPDIHLGGPPEAAYELGKDAWGAVGVDVTNPIDAIKQISAFFVGAGELLLTPEGWLRIAKLGGGAIFILWGLRIVVREATGSDPVKAATKTAGKVAETAATVAVVK